MGTVPTVSDEPILLVAVGGDPALPVRLPGALAAGSLVVAADSGLDRVLAAGLPVDHLVGDLDSARPDLVARAEASGTVVHRHAPDKDATDLELALELVRTELLSTSGLDRLLVVGAGGGRLDHLLADVLLLAGPALASVEVTAHLGPATVSIARPGRPRSLAGPVGEVISLLPVHGDALGVTTGGVRWPLVDADLVAGTTRALSNERTAPTVDVEVRAGVVACVQPGIAAAPIPPRATRYDPTPRAPGGPT